MNKFMNFFINFINLVKTRSHPPLQESGIYKTSFYNKNQFINLQKLFFVGVKLPWIIPIIKKIIKSKPNILFDLSGKIMYGLFMSRVHRMTIADMINYATHIDPYDI